MRLPIDHLVFAASDLNLLLEPFQAHALCPDYGGQHANGTTHMAQLGFADGSYLEFIAPATVQSSPGIWGGFMADDAGPAAWCIDARGQFDQQLDQLRSIPIAVSGPHLRGRTTTSGVTLSFRLAFIGAGSPGAIEPFLIEDISPRRQRVGASASAGTAALTGIDCIVIAVPDARSQADRWARDYGLGPPCEKRLPNIARRGWGFNGEAVTFVDPEIWPGMTPRVARYGGAPCAVVLGSTSLRASSRALGLPVERLNDDENQIDYLRLPLGESVGGDVLIVQH